MIRVLFVGESWLGSCARSLKEALARRRDVVLDEIGEDLWFPKPRSLPLRVLNRVTHSAYRKELGFQVMDRVAQFRPDVVMTYKGNPLQAPLVGAIKAAGVRTVNVYPDYSPHAFGEAHQAAVGAYDLVISTKPYHPGLWKDLYGYTNRCVFVPQGYDPLLHLADDPVADAEFDLALVATWRPEYAALMQEVAKAFAPGSLRVLVGGHGWDRNRDRLPGDWVFPGGLVGRTYVEWLRKARICIAPVMTEVVIQGRRQPGDQDTTRTYELAAAHCFFIHRRTDYVRTLYDERSEVPLFGTAAELIELIREYLPASERRAAMAAMAHKRAVPDYSLDQRASSIVELLGG